MLFFGNVTLRVGSAVALSVAGFTLGLAGAPAMALTLVGSCQPEPVLTTPARTNRLVLAQAKTQDQELPAVSLTSGVRPTSFGLKFDPILNLQTSSSSETPIYIFGKDVKGLTDDVMESLGDAEFRKLGLFIKGDYIRHDLVKDELFAEGQVKLFREGEFFEGPKLQLQLGTNRGYFNEVTYHLTKMGGRGTAERAEFVQPMETKMTKAIFTTCPRDRPAWELRMDELVIDQMREEGRTKGAVLYLGSVPALPFFNSSFDIGENRRSGILDPTYGTSTKLGFDVTVPFYWNIAPQHDATFFPRETTKRGTQLGTEFRFLRPDSLGTVIYEVLPNDKITNTTRQYGSIVTTYRPISNLNIGLNVQRASDNNYFSDLGNSLLVSSQRVLPASITATSTIRGWSVQGQAQEFQLLQDTTSPLISPYSYAPRLAVSRNVQAVRGRDEFPVDWTASGEYTSYRHPTLLEGQRFVGSGSLAYRHFQQGFYITPKISLHATHFDQTRTGSETETASKFYNAPLGIYSNNVNSTSNSDRSYTRVLPTFSTQVSTILERSLKVGAANVEQTVEPKLAYIYTPYKNQSNYPVFDTGAPSFSFAQMFSDTAFSGQDRVADLNQLTAGVTTRFVEEQTGVERFRAAAGQRFYFADQRVVLPGGTVRTDRKSDLLGQVLARPHKDWTIDSQVQYTPASSILQNVSVVNRYTPRPGSAITAAYRYVRGSSNTFDVGFQWPIVKNWYAVARYQQALTNLGAGQTNPNAGLVEGMAGLEFDGGCWIGRVVAQQYTLNATQKNTAMFFQVELSGLAKIGSDPMRALRSVPNYRMINELTPLPSKFDNFQ